MAKKLLEMHSITKEFPGVKALNNVNITVEEGEIHAIVGENGAGKSTLMNVLINEVYCLFIGFVNRNTENGFCFGLKYFPHLLFHKEMVRVSNL